MKTRTGRATEKMLASAMLMMLGGVLAARAAFGQVLKGSKPITNEDIVQMARQGVPESTIIATIKANPVKFDLSLEKMLALHRQGVSSRVLNFMSIAAVRDRKTGGEKNSDELSPQPYPPKGTLLTPGAQQALLGKHGNSVSTNANTTMLLPGVQRPTGGSNSAQPTAVERSATANATPGDGSVRTGASGVPAAVSSQSPAINGGSGKTVITASQAAVTAPVMMPKTSPGQIGPSQTMSAGVASPTTRTLAPSTVTVAASAPRSVTSLAAQVPSQVNLLVAAECAKDPTRRILSVTANPPLATDTIMFTPNRQYTIWGCSLGQAGPNNQVVVAGGGFSMTFFFLDWSTWNPNSVVASLSLTPDDVAEFNMWGVKQVGPLTLQLIGNSGGASLNGVNVSMN